MTQFVFSRRDLQRCIKRLQCVVSPEQLAGLIKKLNTPNEQRLPTMWEVVVLDAFAQVASVRHEVPLPSGKRPDLLVDYQSAMGKNLTVVGDILAISDRGLDENNPVDAILEQTPALARKHGVDPVRLAYRINGERTGKRGQVKVQLAIPNRGQMIALLHSEVVPWLKSINTKPHQKDTFKPSDKKFDFSINYDPAQTSTMASYTSYDVAPSKEVNPLYKALKAKTGQLEGSHEGTFKLLVACDGDCGLFRSSASMASMGGTFTDRQVVDHFLTKHSSIDGVLLIGVEEKRDFFSGRTDRKLRFDLRVRASIDLKRLISPYAELDELIRSASINFPEPHLAPYNAARRCLDQEAKHRVQGRYRLITSGVGGMSVGISSRDLMMLLSGKLSQEDFCKAYRFDAPHVNPFTLALSQGRLIQLASLSKLDDDDDDLVIFEFGEIDPAIAPFFMPGD
ncbi:hypothetical protein E5C33_05225 [Stenotrophomonas maltophilia]|uniref:hypothetical protein n=1 Tax=Stenotrophomonas maltophilia TaxID=40324 RepID=UPI0010766333|nr:hypothetical protein [Stenotrophomonas maltophilia]TFZ46599.1 hypothetical protein E5C33_05225 [Stenotrophomonas maltophilia]